MKKKLVSLVLLVCLASVAFAQGGAPTGGVKQCPPNTVCPEGIRAEPVEPWYVDLLAYLLTIF